MKALETETFEARLRATRRAYPAIKSVSRRYSAKDL